MAIENHDLQLLDGMLDTSSLAAVFPQTEAGQALRDQYSAFVDQLWADGAMKEIDSKWFSGDESGYTVLDYYIIFGSVAISGIAVAVIGFTLTFGAAVFGLLKMGVGTIDRGQYEAAYALGHSNRHTFFKIILPQAIPHVLPAYQGEIVGLIKATAIVGYIAVQDLTKMGDIVRSRTYEAFFPLIAVTVIYFVLEGLFSFAVSRIRVSIDPKKRKRESILKGVDLHD